MQRVNIHLDEDLNRALAREAARVGMSKAALLRKAARALLDRHPQPSGDPWAAFTGAIPDAAPDDRHHDEIVYG